MLPNLRDYEVLMETRRAEVEKQVMETQRGREPLPSSPARKPVWSSSSSRVLVALRRILNMRL